MKSSRRDFIINSLFSSVVWRPIHSIVDTNQTPAFKPLISNTMDEINTISIFSKDFSGVGYKEMSSIVSQIGLNGIDLTVRPKGHVLPENVERDLPLAYEIAKKAGLNIYMITTEILHAADKFTEPILKTASSLGIKYYRLGRMFYNKQKNIPDNLKDLREEFKKISDVNQKYNLRGDYQNHEGLGFGATLWDLWEVLKGTDPRWLGVQYDLFHATVEGADSWPVTFDLLKPYIGTIDIKDFLWKQINGRWDQEVVPLGEGMVDYKKFFQLLKKNNMHGPFSLHCEYLSNNDNLDIKAKAISKDLQTLRKWINEAGL
ncbi:MAG TPA: sugar phosphate isomerase/epimerase family protein [Flavitalea sp.]|nr:sugar phosphate isomerase/epimerase family protein [Flavitalea sp.]